MCRGIEDAEVLSQDRSAIEWVAMNAHSALFRNISLARPITAAIRASAEKWVKIPSVLSFGILIGWTFTSAGVAQSTTGELPAQCPSYASVPLPTEAESVPAPKTAPDCASYRSYRGIGGPVNYPEARACAWRERLAQEAQLGQNQKEPDAWVVGGSLILADLYFNGAGVKRNIPLAMRFACEAEEGMAMLALPEIEKLNNSLPAHGPFEFCDYAATTFTMNFCSGYASEIETSRRERYYETLKSQMNPGQREAFEKLIAAENAYVEAHASEVDQGGTIRGMRTIGSMNILHRLFRAEIGQLERKQWPAVSGSQVKTADGLLHDEYKMKVQQLRSHTKEEIDEGAVTADHLANVERLWEKYRDAWTTFARLRYPEAEARIRAEITIDRYRLLKTID